MVRKSLRAYTVREHIINSVTYGMHCRVHMYMYIHTCRIQDIGLAHTDLSSPILERVKGCTVGGEDVENDTVKQR